MPGRRTVALVAACAALGLSAAGSGAAEPTVYLQPLGAGIAGLDVELVAKALRDIYQVEVRILPREPLPQTAWYAPRRRWRAEKLLEFLAPRLPAGGLRILGLTAEDISTSKGDYIDWGVLGLGDLDGPAGVISSFRCRKKARDALHARERLAKVAVHEIGHTLGLPHCPTAGCLMHDAEGKVASTDREYDLCPRCRALLLRAGRQIPAIPKLSWPRPR
jgi:archaemetzincin